MYLYISFYILILVYYPADKIFNINKNPLSFVRLCTFFPFSSYIKNIYEIFKTFD